MSVSGTEGEQMKVYSPSQTKSYLESPIGWYLHYVEGWSPKLIGRKELSGFLGSAFAMGISKWHEQPDKGEKWALLNGKEYLDLALSEAYAEGYTVASKEEPFLQNLPDHLNRALTKAISHSPLPESWKVLGVEEIVLEAGRCRLDLVVDTPQGISFVDYKTKVTLEGYAKDRALVDWSQDWQFYHYAWALETFRQMPVNSYSVVLVVCSGTAKPTLHTFPLDQELLKIWKVCARETWKQMEECKKGDRVAIWNFQMSNKFGADPWADAIVVSKLDENLMRRNYIRGSQYGG